MASAFMGTLLSIKPILTVQDGMVAPFEKIRGKAKALNRIRELMEEFKNRHPDRKLTAAISNANAREDAERLARYLEGQLPLEREIIIGSIGPTIGCIPAQVQSPYSSTRCKLLPRKPLGMPKGSCYAPGRELQGVSL